MELAVGTIVEGKVTGITKFGAFVTLPNGKSGLVHISEIANTYVSEVRDHLTEGQEVKVKILKVDEAGKISLSIKKALEDSKPAQQTNRQSGSRQFTPRRAAESAASREPQTFEEKLKAFMADSDSKISGIRQYSDHKTKTRRK